MVFGSFLTQTKTSKKNGPPLTKLSESEHVIVVFPDHAHILLHVKREAEKRQFLHITDQQRFRRACASAHSRKESVL